MNDPTEYDGELTRLGWYLKHRDDIVWTSYLAGNGKHVIQQETGLAYATIRKILKRQERKHRPKISEEK